MELMEHEIIQDRETIKVLIVEDNDFDYELVERRLKKISVFYEVRRASSAADYEEYMYKCSPDIILSDFSIPGYSGLKALEFARAVRPEVPFIFVSGSIGEDRAVEALKQGASDYVLKDNLNKLEPSVHRALAEVKEKVKRKEAEEKVKIKNRELRSLVYRISHDFKAPVCTIQGAINLSRQAENKEEFLLYANMISSVTVKLDGIIKNLSNFQYLFADELQLSRFNLKNVLAEAINGASVLEEFKQVKLNTSLNGDPLIYSERNFIFPILYNLIHNAVVFLDKGKTDRIINCDISCSSEEIRVVVEDNGIGMTEKVKERACEMFYRGSVASKGAGLGLYIVKTCTEILNGQLSIESQAGTGTNVTICLPVPPFS